jgi:hypothetical protein
LRLDPGIVRRGIFTDDDGDVQTPELRPKICHTERLQRLLREFDPLVELSPASDLLHLTLQRAIEALLEGGCES